MEMRSCAVILEGKESIDSIEFGEFLLSFTSAYNAGLLMRYNSSGDLLGTVIIEEILSEVSQIEEQAKLQELKIERLSFQSPLEITFIGIMSALTFAVIISGGELELKASGVKVKLPALGKGLKNLRDVFNDKRQQRQARGIKNQRGEP
jgi:hypothetical protein